MLICFVNKLQNILEAGEGKVSIKRRAQLSSSIPGFSLTNVYVYKCVDPNDVTAMLAVKRSANVKTGMNLMNPLCTGDETWKSKIYPGFET